MKIPISFEYEGIYFEGYLNKVSGSGNTALYHLMINNYFYGQLFYTDNYGWRFGSNSGMFEEQYMVDYFVSVIEKNKNNDKSK